MRSLYRYLSAGLLATVAAATFAQEGPPLNSGGGIGNDKLVRNQAVAKAQAVGMITSFLASGTKECDPDGTNCRNLFGDDDNMDYASMQFRGQGMTQTQSFSFTDDNDNSAAIVSQIGSAALACVKNASKTTAGVAVRLLDCHVGESGQTSITVQVCSAPARGYSVSQPDNAVPCSENPADASYTPPAGKVCRKAACDTEPQDSVNGWSSPRTVSWMPQGGNDKTDSEKAGNGLALFFYPNPAGGARTLSSDSDNLTALKIVASFRQEGEGKSAVGLKLAYRHKVSITKELLEKGPEGTNALNKDQVSPMWESVEKLQVNPLVPQYQQTFGNNGAECVQQIVEGVGGDGKVYVCDTGYTGESGLRPIALSAEVAAEGKDCGTAPQCLQEVVNTNTWTQTCKADVPLALRKCTTTQDYDYDKISYTRTRTTEICHERRVVAEYACQTRAYPGAASTYWAPASDLTAEGSTDQQTVLKFNKTFMVPPGTAVVGARISYLWIDNWAEIRLNKKRIWASFDRNLEFVKIDEWGLFPDLNRYCNNESWQQWQDWGDGAGGFVTVQGVRCTMQDERKVQANYSDDCSRDHCARLGVKEVSIPIPPEYFVEGVNNVDMACFNNRGPSYCNYKIEVQYAVVENTVVDNSACAPYEAAR